MAWTYEEVIPSPIANAKFEKALRDGEHKLFRITPNEGYGLHNKELDYIYRDEMGEPTGEVDLRFGTGDTTVNKNYDFTATTPGTYTYTDANGMEVSIPVTMVGVNEYYCVPIDTVPIANRYEVTNPPVIA